MEFGFVRLDLLDLRARLAEGRVESGVGETGIIKSSRRAPSIKTNSALGQRRWPADEPQLLEHISSASDARSGFWYLLPTDALQRALLSTEVHQSAPKQD